MILLAETLQLLATCLCSDDSDHHGCLSLGIDDKPRFILLFDTTVTVPLGRRTTAAGSSGPIKSCNTMVHVLLGGEEGR